MCSTAVLEPGLVIRGVKKAGWLVVRDEGRGGARRGWFRPDPASSPYSSSPDLNSLTRTRTLHEAPAFSLSHPRTHSSRPSREKENSWTDSRLPSRIFLSPASRERSSVRGRETEREREARIKKSLARQIKSNPLQRDVYRNCVYISL